MTTYMAYLRDTVTGDAKAHVFEYPYELDSLIWQWTDGNYGCDCNRSLFLWEGKTRPDPARPWNTELQCSGGGKNRISLDLLTDRYGKKLFEGPA